MWHQHVLLPVLDLGLGSSVRRKFLLQAIVLSPERNPKQDKRGAKPGQRDGLKSIAASALFFSQRKIAPRNIFKMCRHKRHNIIFKTCLHKPHKPQRLHQRGLAATAWSCLIIVPNTICSSAGPHTHSIFIGRRTSCWLAILVELMVMLDADVVVPGNVVIARGRLFYCTACDIFTRKRKSEGSVPVVVLRMNCVTSKNEAKRNKIKQQKMYICICLWWLQLDCPSVTQCDYSIAFAADVRF